jgi:hypothetical protein
VLAGTVALRHAAGLPKAVRDLHANWLLVCRASEKVRIPAAIMEKRTSRLKGRQVKLMPDCMPTTA